MSFACLILFAVAASDGTVLEVVLPSLYDSHEVRLFDSPETVAPVLPENEPDAPNNEPTEPQPAAKPAAQQTYSRGLFGGRFRIFGR